MDDILSIVVVAILYFVAAAGSKKKNKKASRRVQPQRPERMPRREALRQEAIQLEAEVEELLSAQSQTAAGSPEMQTHDCQTQRIHLHEADQRQMETAGEGEDPCHAGSAVLEGFSFDEEPADREELAADVLRGVIMSEILMRPCDRMAIRNNRRSAV